MISFAISMAILDGGVLAVYHYRGRLLSRPWTWKIELIMTATREWANEWVREVPGNPESKFQSWFVLTKFWDAKGGISMWAKCFVWNFPPARYLACDSNISFLDFKWFLPCPQCAVWWASLLLFYVRPLIIHLFISIVNEVHCLHISA